MKNFFLIVLVFLIPKIVLANSVDFYGEQGAERGLGQVQITNIQKVIDDLGNNYGVNADLVILGKGDIQGCYLQNNFDSCVQQKYGYNSDVITILKMKSDISNRGDIRSFVNDKNYPIISSDSLKYIQDQVLHYFKQNDFSTGISEYYSILGNKLLDSCKSINEYNIDNGGGGLETCKIIEIQAVYLENQSFELEKQKNVKFKRNIQIVITIFIFLLLMILLKYYYVSRLKKLLRDIKFLILDLREKQIFERDKTELGDQLNRLEKKVELYLGNADKIWLKVRKYYIQIGEQLEGILQKMEVSHSNYNSQEELRTKIDDFKNINL